MLNVFRKLLPKLHTMDYCIKSLTRSEVISYEGGKNWLIAGKQTAAVKAASFLWKQEDQFLMIKFFHSCSSRFATSSMHSPSDFRGVQLILKGLFTE